MKKRVLEADVLGIFALIQKVEMTVARVKRLIRIMDEFKTYEKCGEEGITRT